MVGDVFEQAKLYFVQPLDKKMERDIHLGGSFKGYTALCGEQVDPDSRGDMHEAFDIGSDDQSFSTDKATTGNQWPSADDLPGFRPALEGAWNEIMALGKRLFPLFALALDLPEDFFDDNLKNPGSSMRVISYPSQAGAVDLKSLGIGAHTDYECFTILAQDTVEALQVLNPAGEWIEAPPIPGTFVVNIADQLQRWTNDIFRSTIHRAINLTGKQRQSMPFFFGVDYDAEITVLPICITPERPAKYPPIKAGLWVEQRLAETYDKQAALHDR